MKSKTKMYRQTLVQNHLNNQNTANAVKRALNDDMNAIMKSIMNEDNEDCSIPDNPMMMEKYTFYINISKDFPNEK